MAIIVLCRVSFRLMVSIFSQVNGRYNKELEGRPSFRIKIYRIRVLFNHLNFDVINKHLELQNSKRSKKYAKIRNLSNQNSNPALKNKTGNN